MTKSKQTLPAVDKLTRKNVPLKLSKDDTPEVAAGKCAKLVISPELAACRAINASEANSGLGEHIDVPSLMSQLREQAFAVSRGDMSHAEAMLISQATALQSLFTHLTERGLVQSHMPNLEGFMRLALKAQAQSRATLEALATIKNPPIVYARQANVTTGPQQINNGTAAPSPAREIITEQNQLSGGTHELLPDTRTSGNASRVDPTLETLGEINRAENRRG